MLTRVSDASELTSKADLEKKLADYEADPGRFKSWAPHVTDTGQVVRVYCVESLYAGERYDLPAEQANKLIGFGYAKKV